MSQFYVKSDEDIRRCKEAVSSRMPIIISVWPDGEAQARVFQGVVQSVQEISAPKQKTLYLVTMIDD